MGGATSFFEDVGDGIVNAAETVGDGIVDAAETVGDGVSDAIDAIEDEFSGLCTDSGATKPKLYSAADLLFLKSGQEINNDGACVPHGISHIGVDRYNGRCKQLYGKKCYPENGEFEFSGFGSAVSGQGNNCNMCNNIDKGYGCMCSNPMTRIVGQRVKLRRKHGDAGYVAPALKCCRKIPGTLSNEGRMVTETKRVAYKMPWTGKMTYMTVPVRSTTCNPKYAIQSSRACTTNPEVIDFCQKTANISDEALCLSIVDDPSYPNPAVKHQIMKRYCSEGSNFFDKTKCREWVTNETNKSLPIVRDMVDNLCRLGDNIHRSPCSTFIANYAQEKNPHYDPLMSMWCKENELDPRCACINSRHNELVAEDGSAIQGLPQCVDEKCTNLMKAGGGLIPSYMTNPACSYYDCKQFIDSSGAIIGDNNKTIATMNMECGTDIKGPGTLRTSGEEQDLSRTGLDLGTGNTPILNETVREIQQSTEEEEKDNTMLFVSGFLALLFLLVVLWFVLDDGDDDDDASGGFREMYESALNDM